MKPFGKATLAGSVDTPGPIASFAAITDNYHAWARRTTDYYTTNYAIHEAIITLANNRWLAHVSGDLRKILKLARLHSLQAAGRMAQSLNAHMAVFAALKARDSEGAEAAMRTHITGQRDALRKVAHHQTSRVQA